MESPRHDNGCVGIRVSCGICPRKCHLAEGAVGDCQARRNVGGRIVPLAYGRPCAVALDPIEKKPLFHFLPGATALSLGMAGCNLHCRNCQNADISQASPTEIPAENLPPDALVSLMDRTETRVVAYTYTEPFVAFEYVRDCARAVRATGGFNVLVSAGYVNPGPLAELIPHLDAANIDLKTMSDEGYHTMCGARRDPVLETLRALARSPVILEVTNLVIPGFNDAERDLADWCAFVADDLGVDVPVHFSRFFPRHRLADRPPTPLATLRRAAEIARDHGLRNVYCGNVDDEAVTLCPVCGTDLIRRVGFTVLSNALVNGRCHACGQKIYGRF